MSEHGMTDRTAAPTRTERTAAPARTAAPTRTERTAAPAKPAATTYACSISKLVSTSAADTVVVFVRPGCPHCAAALQTLQAEAIAHVVVPADGVGDAAMAAMSKCLGGFSTYPRVFVRGEFHGGNDAIQGAVAAYKKRSS
jgi:glutaredoxin